MITVKSSHKWMAIIMLGYLSSIVFACVLCGTGAPLAFVIPVFTVVSLVFIRYWISVGRSIDIDLAGVTISFLWIKKRYLWKELSASRFDTPHALGSKIEYLSGIEIQKEELRRPRWLKPMAYGIWMHPFTYVYVHDLPQHDPLQIGRQVKYPATYELNADTMQQLGQIIQKAENTGNE